MRPPSGGLIVALDVPTLGHAERLAKRLRGVVQCVKIGSVLFTEEGPRAVARMRALGFEVFLDLKFHDIPSTVEKSCRAAARMGVLMWTVHASGGAAMVRAAVAGSRAASGRRPLVLGVTVLTSDGAQSAAATRARVTALADTAVRGGAQGLVASAQEVAALRRRFGRRIRLVCPGIRPAGASNGDQQRVATPADAVRRGANWLVVGRPVTEAADPRAAAEAIVCEMEGA